MASKDVEGEVVEKEVAKLVEKPKCSQCGKTFAQKCHIYRHIQQHGTALDLQKGQCMCKECKENFTRKGDLYRHMRMCHGVEPDKKKTNFLWTNVFR